MDVLISHAALLGAEVHFINLGPGYGYTTPTAIVVNAYNAHIVQRLTLAHECGHWYYGHAHKLGVQDVTRQERQADEYAAMLLVSLPAYAAAERAVGPDPRALAANLGVSVRIIQAWQRTYCAGRARLLAG